MAVEDSTLPAGGQDLAALASRVRAFADQFLSVIIATADGAGEPTLSYAPYVRDAALNYYMLLSELAPHTAPLLARGRAELLFIEAEAAARNPFARQRLSLACRAEEVARSSAEHATRLDQLQGRFGDTVALLRGLADFRLIRLVPQQGRYVEGFGRAYAIAIEAGRLVASGPLTPARRDPQSR